jgi:hypothetical protein
MPSNFYSNGPAQQPVNQRFIEGARNIWDSFISLPNNISWNAPEKSPEQIENEQGLIGFFEKNKLKKQREEELGRKLTFSEWSNTEPQSFMSKPVSPEIQKQIEAAEALEVDQEAFQNETGGTYDGSGNLLDALKEEPPQPTPYQSSRDDIGILSSFNQNREEDSPLKGRGKGVLGQLGKIVGGMFNTEDPNFRDNLVIGLGNLAGTTPNENGLTRQAMENIQARKEIALNDADNNRLMAIAEAKALEPSDSYEKEKREWLTNGVANSRASMANLGRAADIIISDPNSVTALTALGRSVPVIGKLLESWEGKRWANSATAQQLVEQVLAQNLRDILGGQFAALEGYKYLERGYNNVLGQQENLRRIELLMSTIQQATDAKNAMYADGTYTDEAFAERVRQIDASMYRTNSETGDIEDLEGNIISSVNWGSNNFAYKGYLESLGVTEDEWNSYPLDVKRSAIDGISKKNAAEAYARTQF